MARVYYPGTKRVIWITDDGMTSIQDVYAVHKDQVKAHLARLDSLIKQLGSTGSLVSPDQFRKEGHGYWAIRAGTIRAYGWFEPGGIFVISHVISKRHDKLARADIKRMQDNRSAFSVDRG
jgi:hypothetical protein